MRLCQLAVRAKGGAQHALAAQVHGGHVCDHRPHNLDLVLARLRRLLDAHLPGAGGGGVVGFKGCGVGARGVGSMWWAWAQVGV